MEPDAMRTTREFPTKQDVIRALAELYVNRSKAAGFKYVRSILMAHGNGATNIGELDPAYYEAVFDAAGGHLLPEDFYGTVTDVPCVRVSPPRPFASFTPPRIRSPMVADLEARLAAVKAKTKRSFPTGRVSYGNPGQVEDQADDVVRNDPAGEKMS
jgi:hypothetical protein